ncbi:MAG: ribosome modulation factor [Pseudomonadales bacterium]|nr:ribosome modulation factor [Pseudomonadales bacterium]
MSVTKRSKRDRSTRAWHRGYQAGLIGRSQETCPHQGTAARSSWIEGWNEGHQDQTDGAVAIGGLHKRPL